MSLLEIIDGLTGKNYFVEREVKKLKELGEIENEHVAILKDGSILDKRDHDAVMAYLIKRENEGKYIESPIVTEEQSNASDDLFRTLKREQKKYEFNPLGFGVEYWDFSKGEKGRCISHNQSHLVFFLDLQKENENNFSESLTFSKGFRFDAFGKIRFDPHIFGSYEMKTGLHQLVPRHLTNGSIDVRLNKIEIMKNAQVFDINDKQYQEILDVFKQANVNLNIYEGL